MQELKKALSLNVVLIIIPKIETALFSISPYIIQISFELVKTGM
jgi:hypothetical protein